MKILTSFILFLVYSSSNAQLTGFEYHKKSFELDSLLTIAKDTSLYMTEFEKINTDFLLESDIFQACKIFSIQKKYERFQFYAKQSMQKGQTAQTFIDLFDKNLPENEINILLDNECGAKKIYFTNVSRELYEQINNMALVDSKLRQLRLHNKLDYSIVRMIDSMNVINVKLLISKYGMITERKHGAIFNKLFYMLIHFSYYHVEDYEYFRIFFYTSVINGDSKPDLYAYYVDRYEISANGGQMYGSFANRYEGIGKVNDIKNLNKRRFAIGACSIKNWLLLREVDLKFLPPGLN